MFRTLLARILTRMLRVVRGAPQVHDTLRTRAFVLEDALGRSRATMKLDADENALLLFHDKEGRNRLLLGTAEDGTPRITLWYAEGNGKIEIEANDRVNTAGLAVAGPSGQVQVLMGVARNGLPALALFDQDGNTLFPAHHPGNQDGTGEFDWDSILRQL